MKHDRDLSLADRRLLKHMKFCDLANDIPSRPPWVKYAFSFSSGPRVVRASIYVATVCGSPRTNISQDSTTDSKTEGPSMPFYFSIPTLEAVYTNSYEMQKDPCMTS